MAKQELLYGFHAVEAIINLRPSDILTLYTSREPGDPRLKALLPVFKQHGISIQNCSRRKLDSMVDGEQHQGIVALCKPQAKYEIKDIIHLISDSSNNILLLVLDGIQDPRNLGSCLRTANALGVDAVIIQKDRSVSLTPTARKVASGAAEVTPLVEVTNLARALRELQQAGVWLVGTSDQAEAQLSEIDLTGHVALVLGSEGKGMRRIISECCDFVAKIPMVGTVSSFNIGVAAGICLYEASRQRH